MPTRQEELAVGLAAIKSKIQHHTLLINAQQKAVAGFLVQYNKMMKEHDRLNRLDKFEAAYKATLSEHNLPEKGCIVVLRWWNEADTFGRVLSAEECMKIENMGTDHPNIMLADYGFIQKVGEGERVTSFTPQLDETFDGLITPFAKIRTGSNFLRVKELDPNLSTSVFLNSTQRLLRTYFKEKGKVGTDALVDKLLDAPGEGRSRGVGTFSASATAVAPHKAQTKRKVRRALAAPYHNSSASSASSDSALVVQDESEDDKTDELTEEEAAMERDVAEMILGLSGPGQMA